MEIKILMSTPEVQISECAKVCYNSKKIENGGRNITSSLVHRKGHLAVLRFAYATVSVIGISVAAQNQIVRSKHLNFMVQSKRYVKGNNFSFITPKGLSPDKQDWMTAHWEKSYGLYEELIQNGVRKEDARAILPMNTSTDMNITGNLQAWNDAFKLRLSTHAQQEIREVFTRIAKLLSKEFPNVFKKTNIYNGKTLKEWYNLCNI